MSLPEPYVDELVKCPLSIVGVDVVGDTAEALVTVRKDGEHTVDYLVSKALLRAAVSRLKEGGVDDETIEKLFRDAM